jgi:membrane peptidoglycan carboxypeptidase
MKRVVRLLLNATSRLSDHFWESSLAVSAHKLAVAIDLPCHFVQHLLAVEDKRFAWDPGVDLLALFRVSVFNLLLRPPRRHGASTITQQIYSTLTRRNGTYSPTMAFKACQMMYALRLSATLSKTAVLKQYLDTVYFGRCIYGLDSASRRYCGRRPKELTPAEAFFLVERIARPNVVCPARIVALIRRKPVRVVLSADPNAVRVLTSLYQRHFGCGEVIASCLEKSLMKSDELTYSSYLAASNEQ